MPRKNDEWIGRTDDSMPGKLVRDRLSRAQGDCCANCRQPFGPMRRAHCDHIIPLIDKGENRETNLQMLCADCHKAKTAGEATSRAKTIVLRAKHIMARPPAQLTGPGFRPAQPQLTASRPINKFSPIDGVYSTDDEPAESTP